jgi:hypothetical protein
MLYKLGLFCQLEGAVEDLLQFRRRIPKWTYTHQ